MYAIDDPLGQSHSPASSAHYSPLTIVLFCEILKSGDGRTKGRAYRQHMRDCGSASWIKNGLKRI